MSVVITGIGCVASLGSSLNEIWDNLYEGKCGISLINDFDVSNIKAKTAASISDANFNLEKWKKNLPGSKFSRFVAYGMEAAEKALIDAQLIKEDDLKIASELNVGIIIGSGIGGLKEICDGYENLKKNQKVSPFFIPSILINLIGGNLAIRHGVKGPNQSQVTACATGAFAIADGVRMIKEGLCDIVIAGGSEAALCPLGMSGFSALQALSSIEDPLKASAPFDKSRKGFVMADGGGIVILESLQHALKRKAKIYCSVLSYGLSCDAYSLVAPEENAQGSIKAMQDAIDKAGINLSDIDYVNAHATSTGLGDKVELKGLKNFFKDHVVSDKFAVSSIKGATGHMLGASGSFEAAMCALMIHKQKVLPTINLTDPDEEAYYNEKLINLVPNKGKEKQMNYVISNSFGFGGHNISLLFGKV